MKTWEVLKELNDNQKGLYRTKKNKGGYMEITIDEMNYYQLIVFDGDNKVSKYRNQFNGMIDVCTEWKKVKEPVTFEEVLNSDKLCRVEHGLLNGLPVQTEFMCFRDIIKSISEIFFSSTIKQIFKEGKWYLQE